MRAPSLSMLSASGSASRSPQPPEARAKLCGHHSVRTSVRVCGGPRWSPEATQPVETRDRESSQWLEQRHLSHASVADVDPALDPQLPRQASQRQRRSAATNAVHRCCLTGCTQQDSLGSCPH